MNSLLDGGARGPTAGRRLVARPTGVGGWSAAGREGPGFRHASGFDPWVRAPYRQAPS